MSESANIALAYRRRGWFPIPIPHKSKAPLGNIWQKQRLSETDIPERFDGQWNIGVLLGSVSENLVDIDLDTNSAIRLAPSFLPPTPARFGRFSRLLSHWLYTVYGAHTEKFTSPKKINGQNVPVTTFAELRFDGLQTVFPGSTHESGESIEWDLDAANAQPMALKAEDLRRAVAHLATACLLIQFKWSDEDAVAFARKPEYSATQKLPPEVRAQIVRWLGLETGEKQASKPTATSPFEVAVAKWNHDHPILFTKRNTGPCPVCKDHKSFGQCKENSKMWSCFSSDHPDDVGISSPNKDCFIGDALDLHCYEVRKTRRRVLVEAGLLDPPRVVPLHRDDNEGQDRRRPPTDGTAALKDEPAAFRPWRSRSYLTAVDIISVNERNILENRKLEFNEMSGGIELGRRPIRETDVSEIRALIEARFVGGFTRNNDEVGLQLGKQDVFDAVAQVAAKTPFHPVQDYLRSLKWDGTRRIEHVPTRIFGMKPEPIDHIITKNFFIAGAARALSPGCKCDDVFILFGEQGVKKSTFFKILSVPWFIDTPISIDGESVRKYMTMRRGWIIEWAELLALFRARDSESVKGFLSSSEDEYVPLHAKFPVNVKRSCIICGTTNKQEILTDETGNRRFMIMRVGDMLDLALTREWRDQLWAEAVHRFQAWEAGSRAEGDPDQWWLTREQNRLIAGRHDEFAITDDWAQPVMDWIASKPGCDEIIVADVLLECLNLPRAQWTDRESKRVQKILRASEEWKANPNKAKGQPRTWIRTNRGPTGGQTGGSNS